MAWFRVLALLAVAWDAAGDCSGLGGVWHDSATDDVMDYTGTGCLLAGKYGAIRIDPVTRKVVPEGEGLLAVLEIEGKWHPFDESIAWSNGVLWRKKQTVSNAQTPPSPPSGLTPMPDPGSLDELRQKLDAAEKRIETLEALVASLVDINKTKEGQAGRDGYCMTTPNVTDVYVPKKEFVHYKYGDPDCTADVTGSVYDGTACHWGYHMAKVITVYVGDEVVFWRPDGGVNDLWRFSTKAAYAECDFSAATMVQSVAGFQTIETTNKNFSISYDTAGDYYYGSQTPFAADDVARRESCWDPEETPTGAVAGKALGWGNGGKTTIRVLDPTKEMMTTCPLWDPSKYGVSGNGEVDSESVAKLKGSVAAIGRHLVQNEVRTAQRVREEGQSGLTLTRSMTHSLDAYYEPSYGTLGAGSIHNHANMQHTIGLGEFGAVLNGVQFTTRHNDYSMLEPDATMTSDQYKAAWPPQARTIEPPSVPPSVLAGSTVDEQVAEMKEYFKAFHTQNTTHRAYKDYFKPVLCYLEGTWTEASEQVAEPFASERHKIDADSWTELNEKMNFLMNNGQKHNLENLAFLPTSIRGMRTDGETTFEPEEAQWFYRIVCKPIDHDVPTKRFRVKNDLQVQMRMFKPVTREQLAKTSFALFEVNPVLKEAWTPDSPWKKGTLQHEYVDELMKTVPGFDGPRGNLTDRSFGFRCTDYNAPTDLDTSKYTRYFSIGDKDASGRTEKKRGFNDYLFAAQTTHPRVSPRSACSNAVVDGSASTDPQDVAREAECSAITNKITCLAKQWESAEVNDADSARCGWLPGIACVYKKCWTQRWSYAIPLEVVYLTPLLSWNPHNVPHYEKGTPGYEGVSTQTNNGMTAGAPLKGSRQDIFFRTPAGFYKGDLVDPDPADTSGSVMHVDDGSGGVWPMRASGTWVITPEIDGVGEVRTRYPIFPIHEHGGTAWKEAKALAELVMGKDANKELRDIAEETREGSFGVQLLLSGGGHEHYVMMDPNDVKQAEEGKQSKFYKIASEANAHQHLLEIIYTPSTKTWSVSWCTQSGDATQTCPFATVTAGTCQSTPVNCCGGKCPDGHTTLAPTV